MNNHFNIEEIRGFRQRKDPTMTFIGGLIIGFVAGGLVGAVIMGQHILNVLGI